MDVTCTETHYFLNKNKNKQKRSPFTQTHKPFTQTNKFGYVLTQFPLKQTIKYLEGANTSGPINGPQLNGVVPRSREKRIPSHRIIIRRVGLARVLVERSNRVRGRREGEVVELDGAVGDGGDEEGVVGLGPGDVVDPVGGVEGGDFGDGSGGGGEVEDVEAAVAEDAEVLGGGDGEAVLVEGAEFDGVAVEGGFEEGHGRERVLDRSWEGFFS